MAKTRSFVLFCRRALFLCCRCAPFLLPSCSFDFVAPPSVPSCPFGFSFPRPSSSAASVPAVSVVRVPTSAHLSPVRKPVAPTGGEVEDILLETFLDEPIQWGDYDGGRGVVVSRKKEQLPPPVADDIDNPVDWEPLGSTEESTWSACATGPGKVHVEEIDWVYTLFDPINWEWCY
ncbi:uncharacterized protein BYT42DRAFT_541816 [Radiomyces spectabilis]|uniref:uncharacterized protein n=1 Tax=Radiomyces spectabilis TaxID=64574 RepID=UPI00221E4B53|nr:uncharacterized protein BYT42DRAFT_541816 [Radiomyces spectabilis]KAI8393571.1 hypothetical protein BYT42DRAFT_541816 [Radiomyces spectabilis]